MKNLLTLLTAGALLFGLAATAAAEPIPNDIDVTFSVCMSGADPMGSVCVIGNAVELGTWGNDGGVGVTMTDMGNELWEVTVTFLSGTDSNVEYKFKRADCTDWENSGNHIFALPTDGTTSVVRETDSFNQVQPILCGLTSPLNSDVTICFQVCMDGVSNSGGICVIGSTPELGQFGTGVAMTELATDLYQACVTFSAGQPVPITVEYKHQKDDCATWEQLPGGGLVNYSFTLDNSTLTSTITNIWEEGAGVCVVVGAEDSNWGTIKARYQD